MTICAIHQPNFFPWLGYFDKVKQADIFVFLDNVAYPKSGSSLGSWVNRVKINMQAQATWIRCPIVRESGIQLIKDVKIDDTTDWRIKLLRTLQMNYSKATNFQNSINLLTELIHFKSDNLSEYNINAIQQIARYLNLPTQFIRQSDLNVTGNSTELLVNICREVKANTYLCGNGAQSYQQDELFTDNHINLKFQQFTPEPYLPGDRFIPGLSVIDYLMQSVNQHYASWYNAG